MAKSKVSKKTHKFQETVLNFYEKHGRHNLPWRQTKNPYRILVSEVMLQQTQVDRVVPYYKKFLKQFPTVVKLAEAPLGDVLRVWQGLGYNRRAKMLHEAAKKIMIYHNKKLPYVYDDLVTLPGVGVYTAKAVRVFSFNEPEVLIETNIRTVFIHHFFSQKDKVDDREILQKIAETFPGRIEPRMWYAALMDYGSYLKKEFPNPSRKSKHHTKQKPFKGSDREVRGALLREIGKAPQNLIQLQKLPFDKGRILIQVNTLVKEGLLDKKRGRYNLP